MVENHTPFSEHVYTVTELTRDIKMLLEIKFPLIRIEGEISNYRESPVGHRYLTLKDDFAQIQAVIFKSTHIRKIIELRDGMKVLAAGSIGVYEPRGSYQLIITRIEEKGIGELQIAFEKLKRKLFEEGLFDDSRKKKLPAFPRHIGVITSPTGAAIRDILNVLDRRFENLHVILNPTRVQGSEAAAEIAAAIHDFNRMRNVDVIIVGRGGGSLEDLWPFNEEIVARAIFESEIPVISAVGHEIDWTISDFVADLRAPTPSAAAELVISAKHEFENRLNNLEQRLLLLVRGRFQEMRSRLALAVHSYVFREPVNIVRRHQQLVDEYLHRMTLHCKHAMQSLRDKLDGIKRHLDAVNPKAVLGRGYSITLDENEKVIKDSKIVHPKQTVRTILHKGEFTSKVESVE